jgi:1,4-dihydroxy-2-naphthoate octaprenyltransferase
MGSYYLQTKSLTSDVVLSAIAIAMPNVGVLNLNNIRDMANDRLHGKRTLASRLGSTGARIYHAVLLLVCFTLFVCLGHYWVLLALPVIGWHVWYIFRHEGHDLDLQMPVLMFTTLAIAALAII